MCWIGTGRMSYVVSQMDSEQLVSLMSTCLVLAIDEVVIKLPSSASSTVLFEQDNELKKQTCRQRIFWL